MKILQKLIYLGTKRSLKLKILDKKKQILVFHEDIEASLQ